MGKWTPKRVFASFQDASSICLEGAEVYHPQNWEGCDILACIDRYSTVLSFFVFFLRRNVTKNSSKVSNDITSVYCNEKEKELSITEERECKSTTRNSESYNSNNTHNTHNSKFSLKNINDLQQTIISKTNTKNSTRQSKSKKGTADSKLNTISLELNNKDEIDLISKTYKQSSLLENKLETLKKLEQENQKYKEKYLKKKRGVKEEEEEDDEENNVINLIKQTKEEIKLEKNRLSAKRSREINKKKLESLETLAIKLKKENLRLFEKNEILERVVNQYSFFLGNKTCSGCLADFKKSSCFHESCNLLKQMNINSYINEENKEQGKLGSSNLTNSASNGTTNNFNVSVNANNYQTSMINPLKLSIFAGLLFVICSLGFLINNEKNPVEKEQEIFNKRVLSSEATLVRYNPESKTYYSSMVMDTKNQDTLKQVNRALSSSIENQKDDKPRILFNTYKDYSNLNIPTTNENINNEIVLENYKSVLR